MHQDIWCLVRSRFPHMMTLCVLGGRGKQPRSTISALIWILPVLQELVSLVSSLLHGPIEIGWKLQPWQLVEGSGYWKCSLIQILVLSPSPHSLLCSLLSTIHTSSVLAVFALPCRLPQEKLYFMKWDIDGNLLKLGLELQNHFT